MHNCLASSAIDENQLSQVCGQMWSSTANGEQREPIYGRLNVSYVNVSGMKFSDLFKHGQFSKSTAILRSGSYQKTQDLQKALCLVEGLPYSSVIMSAAN